MEHIWMGMTAKTVQQESIYPTTTMQDLAHALTVLLDITHRFQAVNGARHVQSDLTKAAMVNLLVTFVQPVVTGMLKQRHFALSVLQGSTHQIQDPLLVNTVQKDTTHQLQVIAIAYHVQLDIAKTTSVEQNVDHVMLGNITIMQG